MDNIKNLSKSLQFEYIKLKGENKDTEEIKKQIEEIFKNGR